MTIPETTFDFSQFAAGLADAATLLAEAARQMSEAARAMGHGLEPDTHTPHVPLIIGIPAPRDDSEGEETDLSAGQSDSEDESLDGDVRQPGPHVGTSTTSGLHISPHVERDRNENNSSLSQAPMITGSDEVHSGILSPGRYYIVLEEEFDVLPLIAIYASVCRKMLCCMPFIESSQSWRTLLSAISPNHEVLEVTSQSSGWSPSTAQYISSVKPTLLIQSFEFWQTYQTISSISDSFLVWGFLNIGEEQLRRIKDAILSTRHTCAILTSQEYGRTNFKTYLNSLGFMEHPKSTSFNKFFATSLLARFRTIVQGVLRDHKFFSNIESLYKAFIGFYLYPPSDDIMWSKTRVAQLANSFAAKILLHGREEDGSSRFKPDGLVLPVDNESSDKFGPKRTFQLGLVQDTTNYSNLPPSIPYSSPTAPSRYETRSDSTLIPNPAGRWYISFQEAFDAIPFITSQVELNQKVVCYVSYGASAKPYREIFARMTNHSVIRPSTNKKNFKNGISTFNSLQAGLLLLHGNKDISSMLGKVNTVIYWGASPGLNFWNAFKATHTYVLLSNLDDSTARTQATRLNGIHEYPQSVQLNATGPGSPLHLYRDRTRGVMETLPATTTNKIYAGQVVSGPRKSRKDVVIRANYFAARVLLHGKPGDGSLLYPPIGPRPSMKSTQVSSGALQSYVKEGLIRVG